VLPRVQRPQERRRQGLRSWSGVGGRVGLGLDGREGQNKTTHRQSGNGRKTFDHK